MLSIDHKVLQNKIVFHCQNHLSLSKAQFTGENGIGKKNMQISWIFQMYIDRGFNQTLQVFHEVEVNHDHYMS